MNDAADGFRTIAKLPFRPSMRNRKLCAVPARAGPPASTWGLVALLREAGQHDGEMLEIVPGVSYFGHAYDGVPRLGVNRRGTPSVSFPATRTIWTTGSRAGIYHGTERKG
jgi:hypothetical protein